MKSQNQPKVLCVVGPTASGKSKMAVLLARRFHGEIVSVDSMQIYRGMTIGTAAPTRQEQRGIAHHMIGVADPATSYSVARFVEEASQAIDEILERNHLPILVGGTGLYMDSLVRGNTFAAGDSSGQLRKELQQECAEKGLDACYEELKRVDPEAAMRIQPKDEKRILRALEVYRGTGKTITQHNEETKQIPPRYEAIYIGLAYQDREDMKARIDSRVDDMMEHGLLEEVEALLLRGLSPEATAWQAIGYKELLQYFQGIGTIEQAVEEIKLRSRQYAKRQLTWLRKNSNIHWIYWDHAPDIMKALQKASDIVKGELLL